MTILAITLTQTIVALNIVAGVFLLGVLVAAVRERRRQPVVAPNKIVYHHDDVLEGARLERVGAWALGMSAVLALSLPLYWLIEPTRQDEMSEQFVETSVEQGAELFQSTTSGSEVALGCADCHGAEGGGGFASTVVSISRDEVETAEGAVEAADRVCAVSPEGEDEFICQVNWRAPPLNDVFLRFSREEVGQIVVYGRPGTPMPAWGLEGGGAKNDQSIGNILDFLESIQIDSDEARQQSADVTDGRILFQEHCARCHTKHWSYIDTFAVTREDGEVVPNEAFNLLGVPGGGAFGPNLTGDVTLRQFPDIEDHIQFVIQGSDFQAPYGTRGIGSGRMPGFGAVLTDEQIRAIVEYERGLSEQRVTLDDLVVPQLLEGGGGGGDAPEDDSGEEQPGGDPTTEEEGSS